MLICAPAGLARSVENSSAVTAHGVRATAATLTPWRPAWWTAARTLSLSAWTTSRAAAAETSASTSILLLTCRPGSRLHSTKPVKTQSTTQAWWVFDHTATGANTENSYKVNIRQEVNIFLTALTLQGNSRRPSCFAFGYCSDAVEDQSVTTS